MATTKKTVAMTAEQTRNADGSITIRATAVADEREIGAREVGKMLGIKDIDTISHLCRTGQISGWKMETARGNGKWRISLQSVLDYKQQRIARVQNGF